jgi:hypothetical protein
MYPSLLLSKRQAYGMSNSSLAILESYFRDRKNRVRLGNNVSSDWKTVTHGCSLGSSLGPVLWSIYQIIKTIYSTRTKAHNSQCMQMITNSIL